LYWTPIEKRLPKHPTTILHNANANTAFTYACDPDIKIVIFRREEWLKVLMHESFHAFGLDFANMQQNTMRWNRKVQAMFSVDRRRSKINLFEAYTESWALILHTCFASLVHAENGVTKGPGKETEVVAAAASLFPSLINLESRFKMIQMVKALAHMDLRYEDFLHDPQKCKRNFQEETNILAYYIVGNLIVQNYGDFIQWCLTHNQRSHPLQFEQTSTHILRFVDFVRSTMSSPIFLHNVELAETFLARLPHHSFARATFRMSLWEFV